MGFLDPQKVGPLLSRPLPLILCENPPQGSLGWKHSSGVSKSRARRGPLHMPSPVFILYRRQRGPDLSRGGRSCTGEKGSIKKAVAWYKLQHLIGFSGTFFIIIICSGNCSFEQTILNDYCLSL